MLTKKQYTITGIYSISSLFSTSFQKYKLEAWYDSEITAKNCSSNMTKKLLECSFIYSIFYGTVLKGQKSHFIESRDVDINHPDGDQNKIAILEFI